ncbi:MAG: YbaK/EbsC family protein [Bacteroidota bacterium]|jgi:prolyl-tRNA editing enzyme YbaK/EbsC (Cys-tRNA(Pro) deacylase)
MNWFAADVKLGRKIQRNILFLNGKDLLFKNTWTAMTVYEMICALLNDRKFIYRTVHHQPTYTSEESARARGEDVSIGGKAIVMKIDEGFKLFVLSAKQKVDSKKLKEHFKAKSIRFATKEELMELTGLVPGSVPPFGPPILNIPLFLDPSILANKKIAFNAGSLTDSVIMNTSDYLTVVDAEQFPFSQQ